MGNDNETRIILGSYNDDTAGDFSKYTRNGIQERKNLEEQIVFFDIFPGTTIAQGTATMSKWALTGQHFNYMGGGIPEALQVRAVHRNRLSELLRKS